MSDHDKHGAAKNTDRELWREREGDYYADSIHVTEQGGIGINCGGLVIIKPVREWHKLASAPSATRPTDEELKAVLFAYEGALSESDNEGGDEETKKARDALLSVLKRLRDSSAVTETDATINEVGPAPREGRITKGVVEAPTSPTQRAEEVPTGPLPTAPIWDAAMAPATSGPSEELVNLAYKVKHSNRYATPAEVLAMANGILRLAGKTDGTHG